MIHIIDENIDRAPSLSLRQLQYAQFVAIKTDKDTYHILKDRRTGKTGLDISKGLLVEYVRNLLDSW
jgi:hypothetical protein